ncbi:PAAR domain-containing protein [Caballeronia sp. SBC2]|uniref:PAAR domain-containing protein n=1 Tax=Caballeronia sp. SBC2 TaxID=2705547 RepID=UPI00351A2496
MRLLLCVGDEPETGGTIEPYSGPSYLIRGHQVALIGASVHCNACNSDGPIVKAGGPRRPWHHGVEVAHEGDIVLCKCARPPRMIALMQNSSHNDDMAESLVDVSDCHQAPAQPGAGLVPFDQGFVLMDRHTRRPLARVRYRVRSSSGVISNGVTDGSGRTARIETSRAENVTIEVQH